MRQAVRFPVRLQSGRDLIAAAVCREVPIASQLLPTAPQQFARLFDHLVGADEKGRRNVEAKRLGGLEIDDQFKLGWRLHR